jgi:cytochrome c peroxidase
MKRPTAIRTLTLAVIMVVGGGIVPIFGAQGAEYQLQLPLGLAERFAYIPADNPLTPDKIAFGKQLFWDKRWSRSGTIACVSCHQPEHGWSDPRQFSLDFAGKPTARHAPTIINRLFSVQQHWTGRRASIEDQTIQGRAQPPELVVKNLGAVKTYKYQCLKIFGANFHAEGVAKVIAAYVRTILSVDSPYDRFCAGDTTALSPAAQRGLALFEGKARCARCHSGFNFTDEDYHNIGVGMDRENPDLGRYTVTTDETDKGAFKTPTLRDVARRGPYMHDGSLKTLEEVVDYYAQGGPPNPWLSPKSQPLTLTAQARADLMAFLHALTGEIAPVVSSPPELPP